LVLSGKIISLNNSKLKVKKTPIRLNLIGGIELILRELLLSYHYSGLK